MVNRAGFQYDTGVYIMQNTIVVGERGNMTARGKNLNRRRREKIMMMWGRNEEHVKTP